jgi:hypothetical protein
MNYVSCHRLVVVDSFMNHQISDFNFPTTVVLREVDLGALLVAGVRKNISLLWP